MVTNPMQGKIFQHSSILQSNTPYNESIQILDHHMTIL